MSVFAAKSIFFCAWHPRDVDEVFRSPRDVDEVFTSPRDVDEVFTSPRDVGEAFTSSTLNDVSCIRLIKPVCENGLNEDGMSNVRSDPNLPTNHSP